MLKIFKWLDLCFEKLYKFRFQYVEFSWIFDFKRWFEKTNFIHLKKFDFECILLDILSKSINQFKTNFELSKILKNIKENITRSFCSFVNNFNDVTCCFKKLIDENSKKIFKKLIEIKMLINISKTYRKCVTCWFNVFENITMSFTYALTNYLCPRNILSIYRCT